MSILFVSNSIYNLGEQVHSIRWFKQKQKQKQKQTAKRLITAARWLLQAALVSLRKRARLALGVALPAQECVVRARARVLQHQPLGHPIAVAH